MNIVIAPEEILSDPEANAMLQAFYSRSKRGIESRLEETTLDLKKIKEALARYYIGYGHDSIGQCGFTTVFIEGVSLLAAKAIQDDDLYNGQESSTRYIDFGMEPRIAPTEHAAEYQALMQDWIDLYQTVLHQVDDALYERYFHMLGTDPTPEEVAQFRKACRVKAFDIAGSLLPAGVTTNLSLTTSLAGLNKTLTRLSVHPLPEVRTLATTLGALAVARYPSAIKPVEPMRDEYIMETPVEYYAVEPRWSYADHGVSTSTIATAVKVVPLEPLENYALAPNRPKYARLPRQIHQAAVIKARISLDYRSFRDLQRHRPLHPTSPLLGLTNASHSGSAFEPWYLECFSNLGLGHVQTAIFALIRRANRMPGTIAERQYCYPLGYRVTFDMTGFVGDWLYMAELRSGETVHPTARTTAVKTWRLIEDLLPNSFIQVLNPNVKPLDEDLMQPSFKRAAQDIVEKDAKP